MKNRILTNWTFTRALYVIIGIFLVVQSIMIKQWFGVAVGSYFASMGIFAFGCAAGNCAYVPKSSAKEETQEISFEEIK